MSSLALTATAAPPVREDIVEVLSLTDPNVIVRGFDRPNIHLAVERFHDAEHKRAALLDAVEEAEPPGIVYVATKRTCEEICGELIARGVQACAYHGGMSAKRRDTIQEQFMRDDGCDVVVATIAFGMGVDKPNVRWVFHEQVSDSLDSYYQEIGRAGRDGSPARALLFYVRRTSVCAASSPAGPLSATRSKGSPPSSRTRGRPSTRRT